MINIYSCRRMENAWSLARISDNSFLGVLRNLRETLRKYVNLQTFFAAK
jgi:hypothetical protein